MDVGSPYICLLILSHVSAAANTTTILLRLILKTLFFLSSSFKESTLYSFYTLLKVEDFIKFKVNILKPNKKLVKSSNKIVKEYKKK